MSSEPLPSQSESAFANSDVVALCKAGLPDEVVVAKVRQAPAVQFALEPQDLIELRRQGVSDQVIKAMLERTTTAPAAAPLVPPGMRFAQSPSVILTTREGETELAPIMGRFSTAGFIVRVMWLNFPGLHALTTTTDRRPRLIVQSRPDPSASKEYLLIRLDVDKDDKVRSVKAGMTGPFMQVGNLTRVDEDWTLAFTTEPHGEGAWRLTPTADLKPGEYGLYTTLGLYDFAVQ
jgi:hypothetical protein